MVPSDEGFRGLAAIAFLTGMNLMCIAPVIDSSSDHLTFIWDWGDGALATAMTHHGGGIEPDPCSNPGGTFSSIVMDFSQHVHAMAGSCIMKLGGD